MTYLSTSQQINYDNYTGRNFSLWNGSHMGEPRIKYCEDAYCLPIAVTISIISVVGIVSNLMVIIVICRDKILHQPTFVLIFSLAMADFLFLFMRYPRYIVRGFMYKYIQPETIRIIKLILDIGGLVSGSTSIMHIVFMSVLRYFIMVHPLRSHVVVTNKRVCYVSIALWIFGVMISVLYSCAILLDISDDTLFKEVTNIVVTVSLSLFPISVIIILHLLKARILLKSISICATKTVRNMSRVVTVVIISFVVTTTPSNVIDIMILSYGYMYDNSRWFFILSQVARVLLFLNFTVNPFIYFVHSSQLQKSIKKFCCGNPRLLGRISSAAQHSSTFITNTSQHSHYQMDQMTGDGVKLQRCTSLSD